MYRSVRKYRFQGFNFRWLYHTKVGLPFALRWPASGQSVGPTSSAAMSAPIGLVVSDTGLHSPTLYLTTLLIVMTNKPNFFHKKKIYNLFNFLQTKSGIYNLAHVKYFVHLIGTRVHIPLSPQLINFLILKKKKPRQLTGTTCDRSFSAKSKPLNRF